MPDTLLEVQELSMTNTKKEMLDAFYEMKKKLAEKAETELKPEKKKEEIHKAEIIKAADTLSTEKIVTKINELKTDINKMMSQLAEKMEEETVNYLKLKESIEWKKKELKEIYDIEASSFALAALIETQKQKKQEFDAEMTDKRDHLESEIQEKKSDWEKEKKDHEAALKERDSEEKKARERLKEEFEYNFKREQQLSKNAFIDQKEKLEKELALAKNTFETKVTEMEKKLLEREERLKEREKCIDALQKQVDQFPDQLDSTVNKTIKDITERLTLEARKNEELLKKGYEGDLKVLNTKIESLEQIMVQQNKQIEEMSARLEKSYSKVQDIAVKAIEGSSAAQRFTNLEQQLLLDRDRKSAKIQESKD